MSSGRDCSPRCAGTGRRHIPAAAVPLAAVRAFRRHPRTIAFRRRQAAR